MRNHSPTGAMVKVGVDLRVSRTPRDPRLGCRSLTLIRGS